MVYTRPLLYLNSRLLKGFIMYTNQKQVREAFWQAFPDLPRRRYRYSPSRSDKSAELVYPVDTRCAFVDFIDYLQRDGMISDAMADRITL